MDRDYIPRGKSNAYPGEQKSEANYKQKEKLASQMHCLGAVKGGWRQSEIFFQYKHYLLKQCPIFQGCSSQLCPITAAGGEAAISNSCAKPCIIMLIVLEYGIVPTL